MVVLEIRLGNQLIKVFKPTLVLYQKNHMMASAGLHSLQGAADSFNIINGFRASRTEHWDKLLHDTLHYHGIITRTMVVKPGQIKMFRYNIQLMGFQIRQKSAGHYQGIQHNGCIADAVPGGSRPEKTHIE